MCSKNRINKRKKFTTALAFLLGLTIVCAPFTFVWKAQAAGTISGRVFQDFNGNANNDTTLTIANGGSGTIGVAIDRGVQNVQVRAYNSAGTNVTTGSVVTTDSNGNYTITTNDTGSGPYRIEFTNLPAGYFPSARSIDSVGSGTTNGAGSTVQFASAGDVDINLAVNHPADYSQNNPEIVASLYTSGNQISGTTNGTGVLVSFPYSAGSVDGGTEANFDAPATNPLEIAANQIGTTFGLAYARKTRLVYVGAYFKRHAGFGPGGANRIYVVNRVGTGAVVNNFSVPDAPTNAHDTANYARDNGNTGWNAVGKTALGGMALSENEATLYVMNLENRTLYALNAANGNSVDSQAAPTNLPLPGGTACAASDARPFAVTQYRGQIYVGMVCSAESSATVDGFTDSNGNGVHDAGDYFVDRDADNVRDANEPFTNLPDTATTGYDAGEPFTDADGNGVYNLGDARGLRAYVYRVNPATLAFDPAPLFQTALNYRRGLATRTISALNAWRPWSNIYRNASINDTRPVYAQPMLTDIAFDNGNLVLGLRDRISDQVGNGTLSNPNNPSNTALYQPRTAGDVLRACGAFGAWTIESNGRCNGGTAPQNSGEGIGGGEFYYGDAYTEAATLTTDTGTETIAGKGSNHDDTGSGGVEQMPGAPDVLFSNFDPIPNIADMTHDGGIRWLSNSTGKFIKGFRLYNGNGNDNGVFGKAGGVGGNLTLLADPAPIEVGNRVWVDADNDGVQDPEAAEAGRANVTIELYSGDLNNDGDIADANENQLLTPTPTITDANGEWYFNAANVADGDPQTTGVQPGLKINTNYIARIAAADFTGGAGAGDLANFKAARSNIVTLIGTETAADNNADSRDSDATIYEGRAEIRFNSGTPGANNHTLDFGFTATVPNSVSIGSNVFLDRNNDGTQDADGVDNIAGTADDESGINDVNVELLYDANNDGVINGAETSAYAVYPTASGAPLTGGIYFFDNLTPSRRYQIRIPQTNFAGALVNYQLSSGTTDPADNSQDGDDNGAQTGGAGTVVNSPLILLTNNGEVLNANETFAGGTQDVADDNNGDMTVDFGFVPTASLGNFVFRDDDRDGVQDAGDPGIDGVTVTLYQSNCTTVITTTTTGSGAALGQYLFSGLAPGTYCVGFTLPTTGGYAFTTANQGGDDNLDSDANATTGKTGTYTLTAGQNNLTVDAGLVQNLSLGNQVFNDVNNDGIRNNSEVGLGNVTVKLYLDADNNGEPDGNAIRTTITTTTGTLGLYLFTGLVSSTYIVAVETPPGYVSSSVNGGDPDANTNDNNDNGVLTAAAETRSAPVTLLPNEEPLAENPDNDLNTADANENLTVDFGFVSAPTAVRLESFEAFTDGSGSVELKWSTGEESGNLGFNLYRETNGERQLLNQAPIAGNALRSTALLAASGNAYRWTDKTATPGAVYYLEDIDLSGGATLHGSIVPMFKSALDDQPNARLFSDLTKAENLSGEREIVGAEAIVDEAELKSPALLNNQRRVAALGGAKISVNHDGWYLVSAEQLRAANFGTNSNSDFWRLYADGAEIPLRINPDNSIEFFGRGLDTPFTDRRVYYLVSGQNAGLRINEIGGGQAGEIADARSFPVTVERKDRFIYSSSILNGEADNWFGALISQTNQNVQELTIRNPDENGRAHLQVKLQGATTVEHLVSVRFNDLELGTVRYANFENQTFDFDLPASAVRAGTNQIRLQPVGGSSDLSLVDAVRLTYRRHYTASDDRLRFSVPAGQTARVGGFSEKDISIFEIQNGAAQRRVSGAHEETNGSFGFSLAAAPKDREFVAVVNSSVEQAVLVESDQPSNWSDAANRADFVIVTTNDLRQPADDLAAMREAQGLKTQIVLIDDVFDEFAFGRPEPQAVRDFLKTAARDWKTKPKYALLFGDASFDPRNYFGLNAPRNLVPTKNVDTQYMETSSDAWLADFDDDGIEDLALGRLPVGNQSEAAAAIEKLVGYDNQIPSHEKSAVLISDREFDAYSLNLQSLLPNGVASFHISRTVLTDAEMHQNIIERLNASPSIVAYTGHGSTTVWGGGGVFRSEDAANLANERLSVYLLMTCLNGYTHQPNGESLAEALIRADRGAIAVWTSSGITHAARQFEMSQAFVKHAFNRKGVPARVGDAVKRAKSATADSDVRRTWQLVGDPTVFLR